MSTVAGVEKHFWNLFKLEGQDVHVDLTWQQFPHSSRVISWGVRDRSTFNDGETAKNRVNKMLARVEDIL